MTISAAWLAVHEPAAPQSPGDEVRHRRVQREACALLARVAAALPRISVPLTWQDWDLVRVNVYHRVAPGLVRWTDG